MTEPADWAPYASDGEEFRVLAPMGMTYCLTTDDIPGAKPNPSVRRYLHGEIYVKVEMLPVACRRFDPNITNRISYGDFQKSLELFGVQLSEQELSEVLSYADKEQTGNVRYNKFAKFLRSLNSWEKRFPQRLGGDIGCPTTDANLGQGLQVLVGSKHKTQHKFKGEIPHEQMAYDLLTGEPLNGSLPAIATREPLCFSYAEQNAALGSKKHQLGYANLLPADHRLLKISPIMKMDRVIRIRSTNPLDMERLPRQVSSTAHAPELCKENTKVETADVLAPNVNSKSFEVQPLQAKISGNDCEEGAIEQGGNYSTLKLPKMHMAMPTNHLPKVGDDVRHQFPALGTLLSNEPVWKIVKTKRIIPRPLKERIYKEQHSADLQAVQFLD